MEEAYFLTTIGALGSCVVYLYKKVERITVANIDAQKRLSTAIEKIIKKKLH